VNLKDRPRQPVQRRGNDLITLNAEQAMQGRQIFCASRRK
jgi:NADH-quinone oxidoreductase subunit G